MSYLSALSTTRSKITIALLILSFCLLCGYINKMTAETTIEKNDLPFVNITSKNDERIAMMKAFFMRPIKSLHEGEEKRIDPKGKRPDQSTTSKNGQREKNSGKETNDNMKKEESKIEAGSNKKLNDTCNPLSWHDFTLNILKNDSIFDDIKLNSDSPTELGGIPILNKVWDIDDTFNIIINELVDDRIKRLKNPSDIEDIKILEIGSYMGRSTVHMVKICNEIMKKYDRNCTLVAVDPFYNAPTLNLWDKFRTNIKSHKVENFIFPMRKISKEAIEIIKCYDLHPDIIFLDAVHTGSAVFYELTNLFPLLVSDGFIYGDDFAYPDFAGLRDAVVEFCRRFGLPLQLSGESPPNRNYIIRKKQIDTYSRFTVSKNS